MSFELHLLKTQVCTASESLVDRSGLPDQLYEMSLRVKPPYGGGSGVCAYSLAPWCSEALAAAKTRPPWDHKTLKSDRGLNLGPRMAFNRNKPIKNLMFLKVQLGKVIKNLMFLKVGTRNFDRGLPFEIAKRSSPIGVSKTSQNEHIPGCHRMPPDATRYPRKRDTACSKQPPGLAPEVRMTVVQQTPSNYWLGSGAARSHQKWY